MGMRLVLLRANEVLNKLTVLLCCHVFWTAGPLNPIYAPGSLVSIEQTINRRVVPFLLVMSFPDLMGIQFKLVVVVLDNNLVFV